MSHCATCHDHEVDQALDLLGETADGFGPEADQAFNAVSDELAHLRNLVKRARELVPYALDVPQREADAKRWLDEAGSGAGEL